MSRICLPAVMCLVTALSSPLLGQEDPDIGDMLNKILTQQREMRAEIEQLKEKQCHVTVHAKGRDSFVPTEGYPCEESNGDPNSPGDSEESECHDKCCKKHWVPAKRVETKWVKSHKKVTIKKPTPYLCLERVWDPHACCYRKRHVTKYKMEEHEIIVPCMKEVIQETVGHELIKVCLHNT